MLLFKVTFFFHRNSGTNICYRTSIQVFNQLNHLDCHIVLEDVVWSLDSWDQLGMLKLEGWSNFLVNDCWGIHIISYKMA